MKPRYNVAKDIIQGCPLIHCGSDKCNQWLRAHRADCPREPAYQDAVDFAKGGPLW